MLCYKDRTYCGSKVTAHTCGREFTEKDAKDAEKWWGGKDYPVAFSDFCKEETYIGGVNLKTDELSPM
jgi:hypothetical protein